LDLLHFIHSHSSGLQAEQRYRCSTHCPIHRYTNTRVLSLHYDLSQSHCNLKSHVKSSWHSLIPVLPFLLNHLRLPSPELDPIPFRLLLCTSSRPLAVPFYNTSARTPRKTPSSIVNDAPVLVRYLTMIILQLSLSLALRECVHRSVA
jgi:hypothetical protein